ncbi:MAG TPA: ankyrin repeat domain-containing protein, partial [Thermoanaerobaculia bacterium]
LTGAVRDGDVVHVRAVLAHGADPNRPTGVNSWTPLIHAVHKNELGTAAALIDGGADVNRGAPDGMTPLMMAAAYGNDEMVNLLLRYQADPHVKAKDGSTALDFALTGISDIDKFTLFRCQDSTVSLLLRRYPDLRGSETSSARAFAAVKRCTSSS